MIPATGLTCHEEHQHEGATVFGQGAKALHTDQGHTTVDVREGSCTSHHIIAQHSTARRVSFKRQLHKLHPQAMVDVVKHGKIPSPGQLNLMQGGQETQYPAIQPDVQPTWIGPVWNVDLPCSPEQQERHGRQQRPDQLSKQLCHKHCPGCCEAHVARPEITHEGGCAARGGKDHSTDAQTHNDSITLQQTVHHTSYAACGNCRATAGAASTVPCNSVVVSELLYEEHYSRKQQHDSDVHMNMLHKELERLVTVASY